MKIKMLADEVLSNVVEDGKDKGPKQVKVGEIVEVWDGVADVLIAFNRAEPVEKPVHNNYTEQPEVKKSTGRPKKNK